LNLQNCERQDRLLGAVDLDDDAVATWMFQKQIVDVESEWDVLFRSGGQIGGSANVEVGSQLADLLWLIFTGRWWGIPKHKDITVFVLKTQLQVVLLVRSRIWNRDDDSNPQTVVSRWECGRSNDVPPGALGVDLLTLDGN
jgi:hypothetical protein